MRAPLSHSPVLLLASHAVETRNQSKAKGDNEQHKYCYDQNNEPHLTLLDRLTQLVLVNRLNLPQRVKGLKVEHYKQYSDNPKTKLFTG